MSEVTHRRSYLHPVIEAQSRALAPTPSARESLLGKFARVLFSSSELTEEQRALPAPKVDPNVYSLALALSRNIDSARVRYIQVQSANCVDRPPSTEIVTDGDVHDRIYSKESGQVRQPYATISLIGVNYNKLGQDDDAFLVTFDVYPREDGGRIVTCRFREWEDLSYSYEFRGARQAVAELLPIEAQANPHMYEKARSLRLGAFDPEGQFIADRPFKERAFNVDVLTVLDLISDSGAPNASFTIKDEVIDQFK